TLCKERRASSCRTSGETCGGGGFSRLTNVVAWVFNPRWSAHVALTVTVPADAPAVFSVAVLPLPLMVPPVEVKLLTVTGTQSGLVQVQLIATVAPTCALVGFAVHEAVGGFFGGSFTVKLVDALASLFFLAFGSIT